MADQLSMSQITYSIQVWNEIEDGRWTTLWTAPEDRTTIEEINRTLKMYRLAQPMNTFRLTKFEVID